MLIDIQIFILSDISLDTSLTQLLFLEGRGLREDRKRRPGLASSITAAGVHG